MSIRLASYTIHQRHLPAIKARGSLLEFACGLRDFHGLGEWYLTFADSDTGSLTIMRSTFEQVQASAALAAMPAISEARQ